MDVHSVAQDGLARCAYRFASPTIEHLRRCFELIHEESEGAYHGQGVWADSDPERLSTLPAASRPLNAVDRKYPPLYRNTAWRMIGYANALRVADDQFYRARLVEGAEYLLGQQQANGSFLYWRGRTDGWPDTPHLLFCSANAGCALLDAYRVTSRKQYLSASQRVVDWSSRFGISTNANYNSFPVWHQCEHFRETGDDACLRSAVEKTEKGVYPGQLDNGAWSGHNSWIFYHAIIVRAMACLYGLLPEGHEAKPELRRRMVMAVNHLCDAQREDGYVRSCWDPEEWRKSRDPANAYSVHDEYKVDPFCIHALVSVLEWTDLDVRNTLNGLLSAPFQHELVQGQEGMMHLAYGVAYRWLSDVRVRTG